MNLIKRFAGIGFAAAAVTLMFGSLSAGTANAQLPPFSAYGTTAEAGDVIAVMIDGVVCGTDTADADGNWLVRVEADGPCAPTEGDVLEFTVNGQAAVAEDAPIVWTPGGAPPDVANGINLIVVAATEEPTPTVTVTPVPTAGPVTPPSTGSAGLAGSASTSPLMALGLGILAVAAAAGTGVAMRRGR